MKKKLLIAALALFGLTGGALAQETMMEITDLYMIGDAPFNWNTPTKLLKSSDHVFYYSGALKGGDGVDPWGNPQGTGGRFFALSLPEDASQHWSFGKFIVPENDPTLLDPTSAPEIPIKMDVTRHFHVSADGNYTVVFDLEQGKASISNAPAQKLPVLTPNLYVVGNASPANDGTEGTWWGWTVSCGHELPLVDPDDPYVFVMQWYLNEGGFRFLLDKINDWTCYQVNADAEAPIEIGEAGLAESAFNVSWCSANGERNWNVTKAGYYRVVVDMRNMKLSAEYLGDEHPTDRPIEAKDVYMLGDGISWSPGEIALNHTDDPYVFTISRTMEANQRFRFNTIRLWGLHLCAAESVPGEMPTGGLVVNPATRATGVPFIISTSGDNNWKVAEAGEYDFAVNLRDHTISVTNHINTGVDAVAVADENAPVEYFNLQGVRVANPAQGQLVIKRQGSTVKKVIF